MSFAHSLEKLEFHKVRERVARYATSDAGRALLMGLLPSVSLSEIRSALETVSETKRLLEEEGDLPLEGIVEVTALVQKAAVEGAILAARELGAIGSTLRAARELRAFLNKRREHYPLLWTVAEGLHTDKVLEYNIQQAIDESGAVRATASKELQSIRRAISERYDGLRKRLEGILKNVSELGFSQDDIITTREGRMVIPVKVEHKHRVPGFIHSASASGATVFIEPTETLDLNNEIRSLQFQEQREVERILKDLTAQVGETRAALAMNMTLLGHLDSLHAKAKYSVEILGVQPEVHGNGSLRLLQARHPLLLTTHGYNGTVPLDLTLGAEHTTLIISGPNAGGKSVAMKCVGLLVLMTQSGLHIPAAEGTRVRIFNNLFVDIGDEQSIENDLSTFSSHLAHLKEIAAQADAASLVLIDEIGTGTDPAEGGAIAAALLDTLTRRGAYTIATTHHSALKVFAHDTEGVENGAMEFDQQTLAPTYRFKSGVPGSSYALEMAERLGFQQEILSKSREFLGQQHTRLEDLITDLEAKAQQQRRDLQSLTVERMKLDEMIRMYESRIASQSAELKEVRRKALEEARQIVDKANAVIEQSIKEIRERDAEKTVVRDARAHVAGLREEISGAARYLEPAQTPEKNPDLTNGATVTLRGADKTGVIESLTADGRFAIVVFDSVRMRVSAQDLVPVRSPGRQLSTSFEQSKERREVLTKGLDLRGMTGDEAIPMIDKFLDDAFLAGLHRIDIIHGKGTGALRRKVAEFLSHHPRVKSHHLAEWNEGGTGATVVELRET